MLTQEQDQNSKSGDAAEVGVLGIIHSLAFTLEAYLHSAFGIRFIGLKGITGFLILLGFEVFYPHDNHRPLLIFTGGYVLFWIVGQLWCWYRRLRKRTGGHTRYSGKPHLFRLLPWCGELTIKWFEPILVFAAGYGVHRINRPLGTYLITSGIALLFTATFRIAAERERVLDLNDAVAGQRVTAERFRSLRN